MCIYRFTRILVACCLAFSMLFSFHQPLSAQANPAQAAWTEDRPATFQDLEAVFANVLGIIVALAGIAVFVMLIKGGFSYMLSGGDPKANAAAQSTLTWAVLGFVILLSSWFILQFIEELTGVKVTVFRIGQ